MYILYLDSKTMSVHRTYFVQALVLALPSSTSAISVNVILVYNSMVSDGIRLIARAM